MSDVAVRTAIPAHLPALRAFGFALTRDLETADELVQDTVVRAWGNRDRMSSDEAVRVWLFAILRNRFYQIRRQRLRQTPVPASPTSPLPRGLDGLDIDPAFWDAFATLPDEAREALILVGAAGFDETEASLVTGLTTVALRTRTAEARRMLEAAMAGQATEKVPDTDLRP